MVLLYADFGPRGAIIESIEPDPTGLYVARRVDQYVVFFKKRPGLHLMPLAAAFKAHSIIEHNLDTDEMVWLKNRHINPETLLTEEDKDRALLQLLASETW